MDVGWLDGCPLLPSVLTFLCSCDVTDRFLFLLARLSEEQTQLQGKGFLWDPPRSSGSSAIIKRVAGFSPFHRSLPHRSRSFSSLNQLLVFSVIMSHACNHNQRMKLFFLQDQPIRAGFPRRDAPKPAAISLNRERASHALHV